MKIWRLGLVALAILGGCAAPSHGPQLPDQPECAKPDKEPIDGGLGGTGKTEGDPCADQTLGTAIRKEG